MRKQNVDLAHSLPASALPIVLVGLPGAGKTSVGRELARLTGLNSVDTDAEVRRRTRLTIPQLFAERGEEGFRDVEHRAIAHTLTLAHGVVALGGGAVLHPGTRELLRNHTVVHLRVTLEEAARRVGATGSGRPLLAEDPVARLEELSLQRDELYRQVATVAVETTGRTPTEIAEEIIAQVRMGIGRTTRIEVGGESPYQVCVGHGLESEVAAQVGMVPRRVLIVHPHALTERAKHLAEHLEFSPATSAELSVALHAIPDGESAKSLQVTAEIWEHLGQERAGRQDVVIGLGGGACTDLAGFAAATWLRGVDVIQVPTTVLAMVDAAVGGKTGINTSAGKNLVGSFHPPRAVVCDLDALHTLPQVERSTGLAEVVKCGFISDLAILERVESQAELLTAGPVESLREVMERAIAVKAQVVSADLREAGQREFLNYGHTLAHAIERNENYQLRHGAAVSIGCVYAAALAEELGVAQPGLADHHRRLLAGLGLPVTYDGDFAALRKFMASDKKVRSRALRFVLLSELGRPAVHVVADETALERAYQAVRT
ncbi:MAG: 3-dehydroquinate synthase [Buchananella hordeovulneris]|nr:3-dehydroquinate synthase [Buchananella hordeovulneris]